MGAESVVGQVVVLGEDALDLLPCPGQAFLGIEAPDAFERPLAARNTSWQPAMRRPEVVGDVEERCCSR